MTSAPAVNTTTAVNFTVNAANSVGTNLAELHDRRTADDQLHLDSGAKLHAELQYAPG